MSKPTESSSSTIGLTVALFRIYSLLATNYLDPTNKLRVHALLSTVQQVKTVFNKKVNVLKSVIYLFIYLFIKTYSYRVNTIQ